MDTLRQMAVNGGLTTSQPTSFNAGVAGEQKGSCLARPTTDFL